MDPAPRRLSYRRIPQHPVFGISPEFSSSTARLVVALCVTWFFLCLSNRAVKVHGVSAPHAEPIPPYVSHGDSHYAANAYSLDHAVTPLTRPTGGIILGSQHPSALSAHIAERQNTHFASLRASMHNDRTAANDPQSNNLRYPRNLERIYDGQWKVSSENDVPFHTVPVPVNPVSPRIDKPVSSSTDVHITPHRLDKLLDGHASARPVVNTTNSSSKVRYETRFSFTAKTGFALLPLESHQTFFDSLNIVSGDLLFRNGVYRTPQDVSLPLVGVYEWKTGLIVAVSDSHADEIETILKRLYAEFAAHHTHKQMAALEEGKVNEEKFVTHFRAAYSKSRKASGQRSASSRLVTVATQCPFSAVFNVKQDVYMDKPPRGVDFGALGTQGNQAETNSGGHFESLGDNARYSELVQKSEFGRGLENARRPNFIPMHSGRNRIAQEQGTGQEEMVKMTGTFVSERCNTKIDIELSTLDTETLFVKAINYTLLVTVVAFTQVIVLIRQMEMTSTQAGASRVSLMTVGLQAVADSYLCLGHLTLGIAVQTLFNAFATAAFFKFICLSIFLMRWMPLIWKARRPSGFSEGWEAMRRELSMLYSRFYGSLLVGLFLLYQLQDHLQIFIFALYSFWVPQIVLNIVEDHRRPLLPMYILGTSITRLAIPLYFWGCPKNFLHIQPLSWTALALVGWMAAQALILLSQYKFGPRWFIPKALSRSSI